jgi:hypothetical protein
MNKLAGKALFFVGWLLSPLSFWNDAVVNLPVSYFMANVLVRFIKTDFTRLVLFSYWFTNIAGLALMYIAGRDAVKGRAGPVKALLSLVFTTAIYSIIIIVLGFFGIIKPLP